MSDTLPTREEIAEVLFTAHETWLGEGLHSTYMERGIVTWDKVAEQTKQAYFVMADALLARLRPAWERMEERFAWESQGWLAKHVAEGIAAEAILERDALRADVARLERQVTTRAETVTQLRADLESVTSDRNAWIRTARQIQERANVADADLRACAEALEVYGGHLDGCLDDPCKCGLRAVLACPGVRDALK